MKVLQLRKVLDSFATLYERMGSGEQAAALRDLSAALSKADKLTVEEVMSKMKTTGHQPQSPVRLRTSH